MSGRRKKDRYSGDELRVPTPLRRMKLPAFPLAGELLDLRGVPAFRRSRESQFNHPRRTKMLNKATKEYRKATIARRYLEGFLPREIADGLGVNLREVQKQISMMTEEWMQSQTHDISVHRAIELKKIELLESTAWEAWHRSCRPSLTETYKYERSDGGDAKGDDAKSGDSSEAAKAAAEQAAAEEAAEDDANEFIRKAFAEADNLGVQTSAKRKKNKQDKHRPETYEEAALWRKLANEVQFNEVQFKKQNRDGNPAFLAIIQECWKRRAALLGMDEPKRFEGLFEFRVAGQDRDAIDNSMAELLLTRMQEMSKPSEN